MIMKNYSTNFIKLHNKHQEFVVISLIVLVGLIIYKDLWQVYFFQDDWLFLRLVKNTSWSEIWQFLIPLPAVQFYRPLSVQIYYFIMWRQFGLNALGYHILPVIFYAGSMILFFKLTKYFLQSQILRYAAGFLLATSAIFYDSLNWVANFSYLVLLYIFLLIFYWYFKFSSSLMKDLILSLLFLTGLLVNEFILIAPFILLLYEWFISQRVKSHSRFYLTVAGLILAYSIFRIGFPSDASDYPLKFGSNIIHAYRWLGFFLLNWPETIKDYFKNILILDKRFIQTFFPQTASFILNSVIFIIFAGSSLIKFLINNKNGKVTWQTKKLLIWLLSGIVIGFAPIILIPTHVAPHRAGISLVFLILFIFVLWEKSARQNKPSLIVYLLCFTWLLASVAAILINQRTHWISRRSEISRQWQQKFIRLNLKTATQTIYIPTDNLDLIYGLGRGEAVKVWLNNSDVRIIFSHPPKEGNNFVVVN